MKRFPVEVPESVANGAVGTNFVRTTITKQKGEEEDPILMLHGFDSSLLEFRRLMPKLGELGAEAYAVDVLGWGFTDVAGVNSFGAGVSTFSEEIVALGMSTVLPPSREQSIAHRVKSGTNMLTWRVTAVVLITGADETKPQKRFSIVKATYRSPTDSTIVDVYNTPTHIVSTF